MCCTHAHAANHSSFSNSHYSNRKVKRVLRSRLDDAYCRRLNAQAAVFTVAKQAFPFTLTDTLVHPSLSLSFLFQTLRFRVAQHQGRSLVPGGSYLVRSLAVVFFPPEDEDVRTPSILFYLVVL